MSRLFQVRTLRVQPGADPRTPRAQRAAHPVPSASLLRKAALALVCTSILATTLLSASASARVPGRMTLTRPTPVLSPPRYCPEPTLEQCSDPDFYTTRCGLLAAAANRTSARSPCNRLMVETITPILRDAPVEMTVATDTVDVRGVVTPGGERVEAAQLSAPDTQRFQYGGAALFRSAHREQLSYAGQTDRIARRRMAHVEQRHARWQDNGRAVDSCREYAYEKYYDINRFNDVIAPLGYDPMGVAGVAFDPALRAPGAIGTRAVAGQLPRGYLNRRPLPAQVGFPAGPQPRNAFYTVPVALLEDDARTAHLADAVQAGQRAVQVSWRSHRDQYRAAAQAGMVSGQFEAADALRASLRDRLRTLDRLRVEQRAIAERMAEPMADMIDCMQNMPQRMPQGMPGGFGDPFGGGFGGDPFGGMGNPQDATCAQARQEAIGRLGVVSAELEQAREAVELALLEIAIAADGMGCYAPDAPIECNWSPRSFAQSIADTYDASIEGDFQRCMTVIRDDFDALRERELTALDGTHFPAQDYTASPETVDTFMARIEQIRALDLAYAQAQAALANRRRAHARATLFEPGTNRLRPLGGALASREEEGNDDFNASYDYGISWGLGDIEQGLCSLNPNAQAHLNVDATVFGSEFSLLAAKAAGDLKEISASVRVMGIEVFSEKQSLGDGFNIVNETAEETAKTPKISATFMLGPIPVTVGGGLAATLGGRFNLQAQVQRAGTPEDCQSMSARLAATVTPFAKASAFAEVSIDVIILEVGVKAALTLIEASLPMKTTIELVQDGDDISDLSLNVQHDTDLVLKFLDGYLALFGEIDLFFFSKKFKFEIFSWKGFEHTIELLDERIDLLHMNSAIELTQIAD